MTILCAARPVRIQRLYIVILKTFRIAVVLNIGKMFPPNSPFLWEFLFRPNTFEYNSSAGHGPTNPAFLRPWVARSFFKCIDFKKCMFFQTFLLSRKCKNRRVGGDRFPGDRSERNKTPNRTHRDEDVSSV